ncbi:hypothetical protein IJT17_07255 [bacterium]|nr:hypothetical protein [bacterium]
MDTSINQNAVLQQYTPKQTLEPKKSSDSSPSISANDSGLYENTGCVFVPDQPVDDQASDNTQIDMEKLKDMLPENLSMHDSLQEMILQDLEHRKNTLPPNLTMKESVQQMIQQDQENTQAVAERIERMAIDNPEEYNAVVEDLAANGVEINVDPEMQAQDLENTQAIMAAASAGVLDYDALAASLEESGEGTLSSYIGAKLLEAHNNGTPLEEIDFGTDLVQPMSADRLAGVDPSTLGGGGLTSSIGAFTTAMLDYTTANGLAKAQELGLLDKAAVKEAVQNGTFDNWQTGDVLTRANSKNTIQEMMEQDQANAQAISERIQHLAIDNPEEYNAVIEDLAANGIEINVDPEMQGEDLERTQALMSAASAGVLDYEALAESLNEAGEGSLSAYIGEKLLEAHNNGTPLEEIDFGTELVQPMTAERLAGMSPSGNGGGMSSTLQVLTQTMLDQATATGLSKAQERGLLDFGAVKDTVQNGTFENWHTGDTLKHIDQTNNIYQMYTQDQENAQAAADRIQHMAIDDADEYNAVVEDLAANGVELNVDPEMQAEDLENTQAIMAAASAGVLDYDALAASLEESGEGTLSAYIGAKLLEAHNNGTPLEEIDFGTELVQPMSAESLAGADPNAPAGGMSSTLQTFTRFALDKTTADGLDKAYERGLIDHGAAREAIQNGTYDNWRTGDALKSIEHKHSLDEMVQNDMQNKHSVGDQIQHMMEQDQQNANAISEQIQHLAIDDADEYNAVIEDLAANGVELNVDPIMQAEDLERTQGIMAAASAGVLDYDALAESLNEAGEGSLSAYIGEKLLEAYNNGTPLEEIDFGTELVQPRSAENLAGLDPSTLGGGGMSSALLTASTSMLDYSTAKSLEKAQERGLIDNEAAKEAVQNGTYDKWQIGHVLEAITA